MPQDVIIVPEHKMLFLKASKSLGVNLSGIRFKHVMYKLEDYIQMEYSIEAAQRISAIGLRVATPIMQDYTWSGRFEPMAHQRDTADFMVAYPRSFIFNDIGTGKTLSALWADDYLKLQGKIGKTLIVSTLSTLKRVWESEIFHHFMHRSCVILHGSRKRRLAKLAEDHDYYIINHEGLKILLDDLKARSDITHVIMDEGARMRNAKTDIWHAANLVCGPKSGRTLWWMTGSPMPKAPTDAWAQAMVVNPTIVPPYFTRFRDVTMVKITQFKWVPKRGWEDIVYSCLKPAVRHERDECIDLPPCQYISHGVEPTKPQAKLTKALTDDFVAQVDKGLITAVNEAAMRTKLLQVACGAVYDAEGNTHLVDCSTKKAELDQILIETGDKLIIFAPYKSAIQVITGHLATKHKHLTYGIINGGVAAGKRSKLFDEFQTGDLNILVAHPAAMAHGLTLTASNTILWWAPLDDFEIYEQANGRITRPGQERHQYIKHLGCSKLEQHVYERLKKKESMQGMLLDMYRK